MARRSRILSILTPTRARRVRLPAARRGNAMVQTVTDRLPRPCALNRNALEEFALLLFRLLVERAVDGIDGNRRHHAVAFAVGMQAIIGEIGLQVTGGIDHGGEI